VTPDAIAARNRMRVLTAFGAVYFLWGSTFLFIKFALDSFPPFLMGSTRWLVAGFILYITARWRGALAPSRAEWLTSAITGIMMIGVGNGSVIWSEQTVPSGIVALFIAGVPLWMVLADWLRPNGVRPRVPVIVGVGLGMIGISILVGPRVFVGGGYINPAGALAMLLGSMSWAIGSVITRHRERPKSALMSVAVQMIAAGIAFSVATVSTGELARFSLDGVTPRAALAWVYLVTCGSLIGYTAYNYLLGAVSPAKASTYAYVNPVIAIMMGWAFAHEPIGARTAVAATVILAGVAIITQSSAARAPVIGRSVGAD
jgi:drug/metabolite transporter (DMT)-like permease